MGYYSEILECTFKIAPEEIPKILKKFSLTTENELIRFFRDGGFHIYLDEFGISSIYTEDPRKGYGDRAFFQELAPYVQTGSYIVFGGEDGHRWKYLFKDGQVRVADAQITYPTWDECEVSQYV
jgi:hypothetical protein